MVCKNCNHEIDNGAMFCTYCGTPVEQTPEPETQPVENASTEDAAQNPYENVQTSQPEVDNAQPTADSQSQQNPYSQQYGQQNQTYYQQPQPNKTSYGQQFTNSPNNDYGANQSKYGNQYQSYNNGYNQQYNTQYQQTYNSQPVPPVAPPYGTPDTQPVSIGGWIGVMLLTCLPIVNSLCSLFGHSAHQQRSHSKTMQEPLLSWLLSELCLWQLFQLYLQSAVTVSSTKFSVQDITIIKHFSFVKKV